MGDQDERVYHFVSDRADAVNARTGDLARSFGSSG